MQYLDFPFPKSGLKIRDIELKATVVDIQSSGIRPFFFCKYRYIALKKKKDFQYRLEIIIIP